MVVIDLSSQRASLLKDESCLSQLPPEVLRIIQDHHSQNLLDAVAAAALIPRLTGRILAHFRPLFSDICARWLLASAGKPTDVRVVSSFARILPFAPYLSVFLQQYLSRIAASDEDGHRKNFNLLQPLSLECSDEEEAQLRQVLLSIWRLNNFDQRAYSGLAKISDLQALFTHTNAAVKYLSIRIFCQLLEASDFKLEELIQKYIRKDEQLVADLDGHEADFTFLSLYEHARSEEIAKLCRVAKEAQRSSEPPRIAPSRQELTPFVINYGSSVLPRPLGPVQTPPTLVLTPTTLHNLECMLNLLQKPGPILLHGASGAGKTSLVHEMARELGKDEGLVTLHLNDQTDAKMLLGLYTADSKPGSFQWRPGVLTTAVREGRWVLIEDLDRAPTEVMSTLLPLVERGELLIPSRGETIQATDSFRIFATVRTSLGVDGRENLPSLIGLRLWQLLPVQSLPQAELRDVINGNHHLLHKYAPGILSVFDRLLAVSSGPSSLSLGRGMIERPISTRDLLKWCRRLDKILTAAGCETGDEPISETTRDWMFMEAVDCFVSSVKEPSACQALTAAIAEEMHISSDRVKHYLANHIPNFEVDESRLSVGRVSLRRIPRPSRLAKQKRPFASTTHAKRLLEQVAAAVRLKEPILLVGETGIGKTTVVQQLAETLGHKLVAVNLSQQSEAGDLLGGFKPVNSRSLAVPLKEEFEDLFEKTGVSQEKNRDYLDRINKRFVKGRWSEVAKELRKAPKMFETILSTLQKNSGVRSERDAAGADGQPAKRRKTDSGKLQRLLRLRPRWDAFSQRLDQFEKQVSGGSGPFAFAFVEGNIVKAARNGDWVLLDEINLASPDTLESIAGLFHSGSEGSPSILLSETGEIERVKAHPNFRVFGAMNPATDVGKRDLPLGLRSRFTEIYVSSPDKDKKDLLTVIKTYLSGSNHRIDQVADGIADLYLEIKQLSEAKKLVDGANEVPHFSLRTLTRVLTYANDVAALYGIERALYEGFCMGFLTLLSQESEKDVMPRIRKYLLRRGGANILSQPPKRPGDGKSYVSFKNQSRDHQYWVLQGQEPRLERPDYIITPYVERNLLNLVRATSTRRYPILIQGPTSSGKTSMIEYLANFSGNKFVRINNHEHTDLQEYLGTYVSGGDGKLKFQEGLLVQAMRQGSWIVLDELNLAPTDVLEALNRLLDDNRELLIPETQEVVRPHENFMLFATQNPPGLYGGRKALSRAFRNRFLELHFDDIPEDELETILQQRSRNTAPSDCKRIVAVYKQLSRLRQESRVFEQKNSFATLRDLFRWALRDADNRDQVAANGFMLLAERVRKEEERLEVKKVIEEVFRVKIDPDTLYDSRSSLSLQRVCGGTNSQGVIWTRAMRRLYVLVERAIANNEPVLLVGETGCGKTSVCQLLAEAHSRELHIVNAHQNTETGDLIGSQRPIRNRSAILDALRRLLAEAAGLVLAGGHPDGPPDHLIEWYQSLSPEVAAMLPDALKSQIDAALQRSNALFEWCDGSLVHAMRTGGFFLLDEISLADDSVLERLNSVLEPHRSLLLAEKGIDDSFVTASEGFQFLATMNPGGDFGKKELSPALRNRFTEIWVPAMSGEDEDVFDIVRAKLADRFSGEERVARVIVEFTTWFGRTFRPSSATAFSLRDVLTWVHFINRCSWIHPELALLHGAATVFIDTIGANPSALIAVDPRALDAQRQMCLDKLSALVGRDLTTPYRAEPHLYPIDDAITIGDFSIPRRSTYPPDNTVEFQAGTTKMNAMRVIRALQVDKPVLLEGSPGVGKTTLVSALARACGTPLTRINLSDQTDLMDLFGTDVPVEGAEAGNFAWKDAPFLQAMQKGGWVLLDEMNLASQSVLEGLNACLDHRGEVYISELDQVFKRHPDFRLFAAQNPHHQGGGRKGLPSSFVNRFIVVYADVFTEQDLLLIAQSRFREVPQETVRRMIGFISALDDEAVVQRSFGAQGAPWEFNLRDTLRWLDLLSSSDPLLASAQPDDLLDIVIRQRFRTDRDREEVDRLFAASFQRPPRQHSLHHDTSDLVAQVGLATLPRSLSAQKTRFPAIDAVPRLRELESIMIAAKQDLPCILVGPSGSGKSSLLRHIAALAGKALVVFPLNADVDTMDLIGGFEQADPHRELQACLLQLQTTFREQILTTLPGPTSPLVADLMSLLLDVSSKTAEPSHVKSILSRIEELLAEGSSHGPTLSTTTLLAARDVLRRPLVLENPRFEWLDGTIVRAIETGQWLVLDNANLCSASVLDRLNSLLERPDGFLGVNEHSGPGGESRVIKPHPDFRIFLTMDPRFGELSRAMRNRSIEIYLEPLPADSRSTTLDPYIERITPIEASLRRYYSVLALFRDLLREGYHEMHQIFCMLDLLSTKDLHVLERFARALQAPGLLPPDRTPNVATFQQRLGQLLAYIGSRSSRPIYEAVSSLYRPVAEKMSRSLAPTHLGHSLASVDTPASYLDRIQLLFPLHPLQNEPLLPLATEETQLEYPKWLATCYEYYFDIQSALQGMESQTSKVNSGVTRPSSLNRFQRACLSGGAATVASRDSTVNVSKFLFSTLEGVDAYLKEHLTGPGAFGERRLVLRKVLHFWRRTFDAVCASPFDEARFQAHLAQGLGLWKKEDDMLAIREADSRALATSFLERLEGDFVVGFKLQTGLSMETLWNVLRPRPLRDLQSFQQVAEMEQLAMRFDSLRWKVGAASIRDLSSVMESLSRAYAVVRTSQADATGLVNDLATEISSLESNIGEYAREKRPFFATGFEALRQTLVLHQLSSPSSSSQGWEGLGSQQVADITVLSCLPTLSRMRLESAPDSSAARFQLLDYLLAQESEVGSWSTSRPLLQEYDSIKSATLLELQSLEEELPLMGKALSMASETIASDAIDKLSQLLLSLIADVMAAHHASLRSHVLNAYHDSYQSISVGSTYDELLRLDSAARNLTLESTHPLSQQHLHHLRQIFQDHFLSSILALAAAKKGVQPRRAYASIAWAHFAQGCVQLYVPDKAFDPYLRGQVELESQQQLRNLLEQKLSSIQHIEQQLTNQTTNLRCALLEDEIQAFGEIPALTKTTIYRPPSHELTKLQGEFNNVLNTVIRNDVASSLSKCLSAIATSKSKATHEFTVEDEDCIQELRLVRNNLVRLIDRLSSQFGAYQDMALPIVNILRSLQVGLSLASLGDEGRPRRGGNHLFGPREIPTLLFRGNNVLSQLVDTRNLEFLSLIKSVVSVEGLDGLGSAFIRSLFETLAFYYEKWSKKLQADRKAEEAKQSLYRFRGGLEDEEEFDQEEFNELFPDYSAEVDADGEEVEKKATRSKDKYRVKDTSIALATSHADIFLPGPQNDTQECLHNLCKQVGRKASAGSRQTEDEDRVLLAPAFLALDEQLTALRSPQAAQPPSSMYNFYTDSNVPEIRKLLSLVSSVKRRFQELRGIDEIGHHQTLADVIMACDRLLDMGFNEPLAKFISAMEYLHSFVYEWQEGGWASRVHKATPLYERLTNTIHGWRRLELSSWARLFDMEEQKCRDEAKSWWFIAYGALIVQPCLILEQDDHKQEDLRTYAVELLHTLESYFSDAVVGQFRARLNLLRQLKNQLNLLTREEPALGAVRDAVHNFISVYCRYEKKAAELVRSGRAPLDRKMKDVLLLFSWQDKNISALRESSRRSHLKLFKLVRKFRAVLGQPMKAILDQGLPNEDEAHSSGAGADTRADETPSSLERVVVDEGAVSLCRQSIPGFIDDPHLTRLSNPTAVLKVMTKITAFPEAVVDGAGTVNSFISDLIASVTSLRKETPPLLTEENKEQVKHLKNRKTRLFVDTLKTVRQMGFSRNLGTSLLGRQASSAAILADSGIVEPPSSPLLLRGSDLTGIEYHYHKTIDLAAQFRAAVLEHSEDLSREVVERGVGHLEAILHAMIQQRRLLCQSLQSLGAVEQTVADVDVLASIEQQEQQVGGLQNDNQPLSNAQVNRVLHWLPQILRFAAHLATIHSRLGDVDNRYVIDHLTSSAANFENQSAQRASLPKLPAGFKTSEHDNLRAKFDEDIEGLRRTLDDLALRRPDLAFVLDQVEPWTNAKLTEGEPQDTPFEDAKDLGIVVEAVTTVSKKLLVALQGAEQSAKALPTSTDDPAWLTNYGAGLAARCKALKMEVLVAGIASIVQQLRGLDLSNTAVRLPATSLLRLVRPFFSQYAAACGRDVSRLARMHGALCRMGYVLARSFTQVASEGFCSPREKSGEDEESGESGRLETGTGLGEGEGAEDISKDVQPDEDLSELAQEPNEKQDDEIEDQKDAVDMGMDDLEGELGSVGGQEEEEEGKDPDKSGEDEEREDDMDEEAGEVDDLDPTAVDEKMWDGDDQEDEAEKEQQGDNKKGGQKKDEQVGADDAAAAEKNEEEDAQQPEEQGGEGDTNDEEEEAGAEEQDEGAPREELNNQDQNVQETEALALPDDMEIDFDDGQDEGSEADDDLDNLSDVEKPQEDPEGQPSESGDDDAGEHKGEPGQEDEMDVTQEDDIEEDQVGADEIDEEPKMDLDEEQDHQKPPDDEKNVQQPNPDEGHADYDNAAPSDVQAGGGQAETETDQKDDENAQSKASQREQGEVGQNASDQETAAAGIEGSLSKADQEEQAQPEDGQDSEQNKAHPFKKLGDALERWHRNQKEIQSATEDQQKGGMSEADMAKSEFQHLQDEDAPADTQAMGGATDEEARPLDDAMAIDNDTEETQNRVRPDDAEVEMEQDKNSDHGDGAQETEPPNDKQDCGDDGRTGVTTRRGAYDRSKEDEDFSAADGKLTENEGEETMVQELSCTHISVDGDGETLRDFSEALQQWTAFQTKTHALSLSLTSQLRLILTPSQSTKLSGSFRTGKRLNIKKIIPYIASSYKRDKIWMRRSLPTKRAYQILLCVDDSRSMAESSSGSLALESLVMVSRSLAMLESGQVGVLGFGADVFPVHDLSAGPFSSPDAGARVLQRFSFQQDRTDVVRLIRGTIDRFRLARLQNSSAGSSSSGQDLWQLALILSDGLTPSSAHARIRPLLREAAEERIMVVFIIMDDTRRGRGGGGNSDSVLELKEAKFTPQGGVVVERYLDSFPFQYYLIVHHLEDLPGALAGLLRTWFAEVNS